MADLINIGLSGLRSHQTALSVTGNNVANTNTPGYSRQEAVFEDSPSILEGAGYLGQGVNIETVRRLTQGFLVEQVRADTSIYNERNALLEQASNVDNLLASTTTGVTPALSAFFQSLQGGADDPTSVPQRQLLLTQAEGLVSRFRSVDSRLNAQLENIDQELEASVASINSLSLSLAELNQSIAVAVGAGQGDEPNQLLDERDEVLRELSELVSVTVFSQGSDGRVNVFIGNGQPLVVGNSASQLGTTPSPTDSSKLDITLNINGAPQVITNELSGGKIGGLVEFRDNELVDAINSLGRVAITIVDTINEQHSLGMDLENNLGGLFFSDVNAESIARARILANGDNLPPIDQVMRINITDSSQLTSDDYELRFEGPSDSDFVIARVSTGETVVKSILPNVYPARYETDGFELEFEAGTFKVGDRFTLQPTRSGAQDIALTIDRVEEIAFASPIRADANLGNLGNADISLGTMLDVENPLTGQTIPIFSNPEELSPPLLIRFVSETVYEVLDASDPANPQPLSPPLNNLTYNQGINNTIFTADPGQTAVSSTGPDSTVVPAPVASPGPYGNGFGTQNLTVLSRDLETGVVSSQAVNIVADSSAETIAAQLTALQGVSAVAYTQVRLDNFFDDGDPTPLGVTINGQAITLPAGAAFNADNLADAINSNTTLQSADIVAVSNGLHVDLRSFTGLDIQIEVTGAGDSLDVSKLDPYTAGAPVLSTQTVNSGQGTSVGGMVDITMSEGVSFTADVASVFTQAPVAESTYLGFQFVIQGEPEAGDKFTIDYNLDGVSDNRNATALAALETQGLIGGGVVSYGEAYSQIIERIGTVTNRARLDTESAEALLAQSEANRDSVSGVNLDEEAGRLIQYQAAYNASAQVVSVARELFDTLLSTFR